jgi:adenylylsulfate kinase
VFLIFVIQKRKIDMIIQVIGLPGAGKTTFAKELATRINAIHFNADEVREDLNKDLGFSNEDRVEQARRMGALSRLIAKQGHHVVVDFVNPTEETRKAFGTPDKVVWLNRKPVRDFPNTTAIWELPLKVDLMFDDLIEYTDAVRVTIIDFKLHDWRKPTTLMLGRYQPWHEGHHALYEEAGKRTKQVLLGVRDTYNTSPKDPLTFDQVKGYIAEDSFMQDALVLKLPNITNIVYGRDVGYKIEQVSLGADIEAISATEKRKQLGL